MALYRCGKPKAGFSILSKVHRAAFLEWASLRIERLIRNAVRARQRKEYEPLSDVYAGYVRGAAPSRHTARIFANPEKLLQGNAIVLKSPGVNEKGVILLYYSYTYQCFARLFDLPAIMKRYYLVLEPSWSGLCDLNLLLFTQSAHPVFVGTNEPRDAAFLKSIDANLVPVRFGNNDWVDHRVFRPLPGVRKDVDVIMIAGWGSYKRHWAFFSALRKLRRRGVKPRVALVGYPLGNSKERLQRQAAFYGISDLVEFYEWLGPEQVNVLLNRAKVNVLWSRREGSPRSIIEGMFADVPCIVRQGFNFGHRYHYINHQTGQFSSEVGLADAILGVIEGSKNYSPREWVMEHMSCQRTTARLNEAIRAKALELNEFWTRDLVIKTNELNRLHYWSSEDERLFAADYDFLRSVITHTQTASTD
jgi:glycosyltransferase involved in cell wall biosynthesis